MKMNQKNFLGYLEGIISIFTNLLLFIIKFIAGKISGSTALIADAWHTLSDSITSIIVLISIKIGAAPPDRKHPFGHGRIELIGAIVIGILLCVVGFNFIIESIMKFKEHSQAHYTIFTVIVTIISILLKEALAQFSIRTGKYISSKALIADGWHHRSDALSSIVILAGIFLGRFFWWIDSALGIAVSLFIFYTAYDILKSAINPLMGESPDDDFKNKVRGIIREITDKDLNVHHFHIHKYGHHTELTFHIQMPKDTKLFIAHNLATKIEHKILSDMDITATIHMEPK